MSAVTADTIADISTIGEKFLCTSSSANKTPAKGALNAAAKPALAPLVSKNISSFSVISYT